MGCYMPCVESVYLVFCWTKGLLVDACKKSRLLLTAGSYTKHLRLGVHEYCCFRGFSWMHMKVTFYVTFVSGS